MPVAEDLERERTLGQQAALGTSSGFVLLSSLETAGSTGRRWRAVSDSGLRTAENGFVQSPGLILSASDLTKSLGRLSLDFA